MGLKLQNRILIVNTAILAGLAFQYFRGTHIFAIAIIGFFVLMVANMTFLVRARRARKAP